MCEFEANITDISTCCILYRTWYNQNVATMVTKMATMLPKVNQHLSIWLYTVYTNLKEIHVVVCSASCLQEKKSNFGMAIGSGSMAITSENNIPQGIHLDVKVRNGYGEETRRYKQSNRWCQPWCRCWLRNSSKSINLKSICLPSGGDIIG